MGLFDVFRDNRKIARMKRELVMSQIGAEMKLIHALSPSEKFRKDLYDPDESSWRLLGGKGEKELEEQDRMTLIENATRLFYKNPHARNLIRLMEKYIVGRGFAINPVDQSPHVKRWLDMFWRLNRMEIRKKEIIRRSFRDGECFLRFFPDTNGMLMVRFMDPDLVEEPDPKASGIVGNPTHGIETNREDIEDILAYWYKDERVPAEDVYHIKLYVDSDVKRGRSYYEPVIAYMEYYKKWLHDRMKLNLIRAMVALVKKVAGTPTQAANIADQYKTSKVLNPDKTPKARIPEGVSVITTNQGVDYEMLSPNLQASDVQHDGRNILLAVAAGSGLPEYMVTSDASNANFASTMVAEAPGVREFMDWQDYFGVCFSEISEKVIRAGMAANEIPEKQMVEEPFEVIDPKTGETKTITMPVEKETSTEVDITFPEIIHRDLLKETQAYVMQSNQGWISNRTASARLDLDFEKEQDEITEEGGFEEEPEQPDQDEEYLKARSSAMKTKPPEGKEEPEG